MSSLRPHLTAIAGRMGIALLASDFNIFRTLVVLGFIFARDHHAVQYHLTMALYLVKFDQLITAALALVALAVVIFVIKTESTNKQRQAEAEPWTGPGKPLLFPCITTHTRLVPKQHSFVYSYLVVGVPVGWTGVCGGMISVATDSPTAERKEMKKGWYHIDAEDYLERGYGDLGLRGKLDSFLKSERIEPEQYPHAYFVTAAKFLGYHFNPISFWYLYDTEKQLKAIVLEVNNTFGERRMYYLPLVLTERNGEESSKKGTLLFKQAWPKDFHVSPFNSRKGSYELLANDPLAPNMQGAGPIAVTVVLRTFDKDSKLVARLFTERQEKKTEAGATTAIHSLDPAVMSLLQKTKFLAAWWWVGFATFPRIVKHAGILFFRKRLHVWFRPEPLAESMSRSADSTETMLESAFSLYLQHLVSNVNDKEDEAGSNKPLAVVYYPSGIPNMRSRLFTSPSANRNAVLDEFSEGEPFTKTDLIIINVLTPIFYTRFVHYAHDVEAIFRESLENDTLEIRPPGAAAILTQRVLTKATVPPPVNTGLADYISFKIIQKLRRPPAPIKRPMIWPKNRSEHNAETSDASVKTDAAASHKVSEDLRYFRLSAMDGFFLSSSENARQLRASYLSALLSLFVADRFLLGSQELLSILKFGFFLFSSLLRIPILLWIISKLGLY